MHVQVNTDNNIEGHESLAAEVKGEVEHALEHVRDRITRVEVHLSDQNSHKGGDDKRCMMEARAEGRGPQAVTHQAATLHDAVGGAAEKLRRAVESDFAKLRERH